MIRWPKAFRVRVQVFPVDLEKNIIARFESNISVGCTNYFIDKYNDDVSKVILTTIRGDEIGGT